MVLSKTVGNEANLNAVKNHTLNLVRIRWGERNLIDAKLVFRRKWTLKTEAKLEQSFRGWRIRDMSAADKLGGYASGFGNLDAEAIASNVTADYKLLDKDGAVYGKDDLSGYVAELRKLGDKMEITDVVVEGGTAWCKWQLGDIVGAGMIGFGDEGVTQEQLFYF
jgi:hypothetical protein